MSQSKSYSGEYRHPKFQFAKRKGAMHAGVGRDPEKGEIAGKGTDPTPM